MFTLSGFISLDARYSGFLVPAFSSRTSNLVFVQDLCGGFLIRKFMMFDIENYHSLNFIPPPLQKNIGEDGILAFAINESVLFGEYSDLLKQLKVQDLSNVTDIFSLVDLFSFCEDRDNLNRSIKLAKDKFRNKAFAECWGGMETASDFGVKFRQRQSAPLKKPRDEFESAIDRLIDDAQSEHWYRSWRKLWATRPGDERLLRLAKWWCNNYLYKFGASHVLITILSDRHLAQGYDLGEFVALAEKWLLTHNPEGAAWSNLWLQTTKGSRSTSIKLIEAAQVYLSQIPDSIVEGKGWSRVWQKIRGLTGEDEHLANLARQGVRKLSSNRDFIRSVMLDLVRWETAAEWCLPVITDWLRSYDCADNSWASAFIAVSHIDEFPAWEIGSSWLKSQSNLRSWYKVWRVLYDRGGHEEEAISIARNWLKRTDTAIGTWPQVMAEVLRSRFSIDDDEELARKWLDVRIYLQISTSKSDLIKALEYGR